MRKSAALILAVVCSVLSLRAQDGYKTLVPFSEYVSVQVGEMMSYGENAFTYLDNSSGSDLFHPIIAINAGRGFGDIFEGRISLSYGKNSGACNSLNTASRGFYPYTFKSVNLFGDLVLKGLNQRFAANRFGVFFPKIYVGIGAGYSFDFSDPKHPWQDIEDSNFAFGVRMGFIGEYDFSPHWGVYFDLCVEGFTDMYNGLRPTEADQDLYEDGYAGFPMDLRAMASFGVIYRFK